MTGGDLVYLDRALDFGVARSPVLEVGARILQPELGNSRRPCEARGLEWHGADIEPGEDADVRLDILDASAVALKEGTFGTVIMLNLLEHVYDPLRALEHALRLTGQDGALIVASPAVWDVHRFPADYWRPLPDFYLEFAARHALAVTDLAWITGGRVVAVNGEMRMPSKLAPEAVWGRRRELWSRAVHRAFRTIGRDLFYPHVALGATLVRRGAPTASR